MEGIIIDENRLRTFMRSSPLSHRRSCGSGVQSVLSQARSFSSTQRRPAQELFPEIKRKLTREAEKVVNKERTREIGSDDDRRGNAARRASQSASCRSVSVVSVGSL